MRLEALKYLYDKQNNADELAKAAPIAYRRIQLCVLTATCGQQTDLIAKKYRKWPTNRFVGRRRPTTTVP